MQISRPTVEVTTCLKHSSRATSSHFRATRAASCTVSNTALSLTVRRQVTRPSVEEKTRLTLFSGTGAGEHVPRSAFVDPEPMVVEGLRAADLGRRGRHRHFVRGHNNIGKEIVDEDLVDDCSGFQGFGSEQDLWRKYWALVSDVGLWIVCRSHTGSLKLTDPCCDVGHETQCDMCRRNLDIELPTHTFLFRVRALVISS